MGDLEKMQPRPFKRNFPTLQWKNNGCRFAATLLDEFKKAWGNLSKPMGRRSEDRRPAHCLAEFPAGYSLTGCSPACRLRFTSRSRSCCRASPTQGPRFPKET